MKTATLHITDYVQISLGSLSKNGEIIFKTEHNKSIDFLSYIYRNSGLTYPKFFKMDNLSKASVLASHFLLQNRSLEIQHLSDKTSILFCNSSSSLDTDIKHLESIQNPSNYFPSPAVFVYTLPNIAMGEICIKYGIKGENTFFVLDEFQNTFILNQVERIFSKTDTHLLILGWTEVINDSLNVILCTIEFADFGLSLDPKNLQKLFTHH